MPHNPQGQVEVIVGSMFSGKTEELIRRARRAVFAQQRVRVFKPSLDDRFSEIAVVSRAGPELLCTPISEPSEILALSEGYGVVAVDEVQFFQEEFIDVVDQLAKGQKRVLLAGLDLDSFGKPFGIMPELVIRADYITKLHAVCSLCGEDASRSFRKNNNGAQIEVGSNQYEPRCRGCFQKGQDSR